MSTEPACSRCRHWGTWGHERRATADEQGHDPVDELEGSQLVKACGRVPHLESSTELARDDYNACIKRDGKYVLRLTKARQDTLAFVRDGSDYLAVLLTRAEFYCAHFERSET